MLYIADNAKYSQVAIRYNTNNPLDLIREIEAKFKEREEALQELEKEIGKRNTQLQVIEEAFENERRRLSKEIDRLKSEIDRLKKR